ncbi:recombinase RmuC [Salipiger sp. CCB-MM3]|uniref:DNA recombination protein RmuC n=1 Tax=Roseobacteraceae TaxID=2854170 RepID=UPI00080A9A37|nr:MULTISPECIES: DNA recombination protein RmuC [Roseobacteraceae]ANT60386.1 recombinase RmuC [Salipiger sp. CCB-MM3]MCA0997495.1 DNA recombination protein RmuC [Alloyangia pacifica]
MIEIAGQSIAASDPRLWAAAGAALLAVLMIMAIRASNRAARLGYPLSQLSQRVQALSEGQERLSGGLHHVSEAQVKSQNAMLQLMEKRLAQVQQSMTENLHGNARRTAHSLGQLQERLKTIDQAQENITRLSGDVLSLQDILSNKQTRGAFGEIQLRDIVTQALPADSYRLQATLSNGRRADCLIKLPEPPGHIVIDAKFPLEAYEMLRRAETPEAKQRASQAFRMSVRKHIRDISDRYILDGETAESALMFLPSEAVYAELHGNFPEMVREGFGMKVWIVSPTTCMATLNTLRAVLKDARMREQAGAIRRELALLAQDMDRLGARVENLDRHFGMAARDLSEIRTSAEKAGRRAQKLDNFDFEDLAPEGQIVPLPRQT